MIDDATPLLPARNADALWIGSAELAAVSGISPRKATAALRKCLDGQTWRGHTIDVRKITNTAGTGGIHLQVFVPSLPKPLAKAWQDKHPEVFSPVKTGGETVPFKLESNLSVDPKAIALAKWKESMIAPALLYPCRTKQRAATIKDIAGKLHTDPQGKRAYIPEKTLYGWIAAYERPERGGLPALVRKPRNDKGQRVILNRAWDDACPLVESQKAEIADAIAKYIKSLWGNGIRGWAKVEQLASSKLMQICQEAGWQYASYTQCRLGRHAVERFAEYKLIAIKEKDAKKFADLYQARIIRSHTNREPMSIVFGDVHPIDVYLKREDGSPVTPRLIAWYDLATHRLHATLVILDKGKGITQTHISAAFANMVAEWGLPLRLYLDNGKEYDWKNMVEGFETLTGLVMNFMQFTADLMTPEIESSLALEGEASPDREPGGIIRARPYNAPAKPIEAAFAVLEKWLSHLPGWIGGDRMSKKTQNVGKEPEFYPGKLEDFHADFDNALKWYHATPQGKKSNLAGLSPNQAYQAKIDAGWKPVICQREALIYAMSETLTPKVQNKGIQVDGIWYEAPELTPYRQRKVTVKYAKWAPERLILDRDGKYSWVPRAPVFDALDVEGAIEQGRRQKDMTNHIAGMKVQTYRLDLPAEVARHVGTLDGAPETPDGMEIEFTPEIRNLIGDGKNMSAVPRQKARVLQTGQFIDPDTGEVRDALEGHYQEPNKKLGGAATPPNPNDEFLARYGT